MGSVGAMQRKFLKPTSDNKGGFRYFEGDKVAELTDARKTFVRRTGGKLKDVRTAGIYKSMTEEEKKRYQKLNPNEFPLGFKLGKKSILGE
jgi:1,2-phenylacetyl-CoA epoxidase PaaB subunit